MSEKVDRAWLDVARDAGRADRDMEVAELRAEIARLRKQTWDQSGLLSELEHRQKEIERLRAERDAYKGTLRYLAGEGVTAARRALEGNAANEAVGE